MTQEKGNIMQKHGIVGTWFFIAIAVVIVTNATVCAAAGKKSPKDPVQARIELSQILGMIPYDEEGFVHVAGRGDKLAVELFIDSGMDVNANGGVALREASARGHTEIVKLLLDIGANVNAINSSDEPALIEALGNNHPEIAKLLLDKGADVNAKRSGGRTAWMEASARGYTEFVKLLLDKGADVNAKDGIWTALNLAQERRHPDIVQLLKNAGAK
jgi:hypothetical protein